MQCIIKQINTYFFANFFETLQKLFHAYENLFSTKRKTFFNEVKIFFHRYEKTETKALSLVFTSSSLEELETINRNKNRKRGRNKLAR